MARLPYADEDSSPEVKALSERIRAERGGRLLNLYKMLLNSPPVAEGWLALLTAIRQKSRLPGDIRELAILRVAIINGAQYEYGVHVPFALKEGVTQAQIDALGHWEGSDLYSGIQRAVLAYTDSMTKEVHVPDATFEQLRPHLPARELVELTATIGAYNLVSRFLEALGVDPEAAHAQVRGT
ncbi:MAG: carboxymuconolactone decarboxylase family protein [Betaproteobacteria bacterium]|nr:carboxymuconolactone decarboxylase family protein [Betaproteobacteria bacterium]